MIRNAVLGLLLACVLSTNAKTQTLNSDHPAAQEQPTSQAPAANTQSNRQKPAPPPIIINIIPAQKSEDERAYEAKEQHEKAELDRKLVDLTEELAYFTAGLFVATVALVLATGVLGYFGWRQARDMKTSIISVHRPRLRVRNFAVNTDRSSLGPHLIFDQRHPVQGQIYIANIGGSKATLIEASCHVFANQMGLPMVRPYEGREPSPVDIMTVPIPAGSSIFLTFSDNVFATQEEADRAREGHHPVYILGFLVYKDDLDVARRTAFCRRYDSVNRRFVIVENTDYEYEE